MDCLDNESGDEEGSDGIFGRDEVRSTPERDGEWLSIDDSVFERPSMRLASFVGVTDGEESNIPEKSSDIFRRFEDSSTSFRFALGLLPYVCIRV